MMQPVDMLRHLVELESPTGDAERMAHIRRFLAAELAALGAQVEQRGEHLVAAFGPQAPGETITVAAHMDTVWPAGTL
jgi:glutamate carboxypeptidase